MNYELTINQKVNKLEKSIDITSRLISISINPLKCPLAESKELQMQGEDDADSILIPTDWTLLSPLQMQTHQRFDREIPAPLNFEIKDLTTIEISDSDESIDTTNARMSQLANELRGKLSEINLPAIIT